MRRTKWNAVGRRREVQLPVRDLTSQVRHHHRKQRKIIFAHKIILFMSVQIFRWVGRAFVVISINATIQTSDEAENSYCGRLNQ